MKCLRLIKGANSKHHCRPIENRCLGPGTFWEHINVHFIKYSVMTQFEVPAAVCSKRFLTHSIMTGRCVFIPIQRMSFVFAVCAVPVNHVCVCVCVSTCSSVTFLRITVYNKVCLQTVMGLSNLCDYRTNGQDVEKYSFMMHLKFLNFCVSDMNTVVWVWHKRWKQIQTKICKRALTLLSNKWSKRHLSNTRMLALPAKAE